MFGRVLEADRLLVVRGRWSLVLLGREAVVGGSIPTLRMPVAYQPLHIQCGLRLVVKGVTLIFIQLRGQPLATGNDSLPGGRAEQLVSEALTRDRRHHLRSLPESFLLLEARLFATGGSDGCRQLRLCQVWLGFGVELLLWELIDIRSWLRLDAMRHCLRALALFLGRALLLDCK